MKFVYSQTSMRAYKLEYKLFDILITVTSYLPCFFWSISPHQVDDNHRYYDNAFTWVMKSVHIDYVL